MRAAVLEASAKMAIRSVPDPPLQPGCIAVSPKAVGICGTDLHVYLGTMEHRVPYPAILGHEMAGLVAEVAPDVSGFRPGDPVAVDNVWACGRCPRCAEGQLNVCERLRVVGIDCPGGLAERIVVPASLVYHYPRSLPIHHGVMVELYSVAIHASRRTQVETGDTVVILGAGKVGLSLLDVLRRSPARRLISVDIDPFRLGIARELGADVVLNPLNCNVLDEVRSLTDGRGADKVLEAIGHPTTVPGRPAPATLAFELIRSAGQVTMIGQGEQTDSVYWREFVLKEATVKTSRLNLGDFPRAISLLEAGHLHPDSLITHRVPLDAAPAAFADLAARKPGMLKVVVELP
ncbi:MAG TPA: alcohol dehydrogenase catalytic domain-containing protein [Planctomycetota bacterium]|nr:alcohol dehydrogenase catalytic domain-containing protein [Planctomycetota bacterium]